MPLSTTAGAAWAWMLLEAVAIGGPTGPTPQPLENGVDASVAPGDDFFRYANGEWLADARLPGGIHRWGARDEINRRTARQLAQVIRDPGDSLDGRKVAAFRAAYLDEAAIEAKGVSPAAPLLESIDRLRDKAGLSRWLGAHMRADVDPLGVGTSTSQHLFGFAASYGIHGEANYQAFLTQGGLSHAGRDEIAQVFTAAGFAEAERRAAAVLALEATIARTHASAEESGKESNADNVWRWIDFPKLAPGIDWSAFFLAAGLVSPTEIVVWQPEAIRGSAALVASEPLPVWKDYLRFQVLYRNADVLPRSFGAPPAPREKAADDATNAALPDAVGRLYAERFFAAGTKARVQGILDGVVAAFRKRVAASAWMSADAKRTALAKLDAMYFGVGYPEKWRDDSRLRIDPRDAFGNAQRIAEWNYRSALAKVGRPVDRREWAIAPQAPGAILNFQLNAYNFAAALLQPPKFDPDASEAMNYGAIGAIFAHEVSHFVDTLGAEYDVNGVARTWWNDADQARYAVALKPLVAQFSTYRPYPDLGVDGKRTLTENAADLVGLVAAFDAYREAIGRKAASAEMLRQQDRQFFIGFARGWRSRLDDEALRAQLKGDAHAPDGYRIATVRNLDAWYDAFDVRPGQALYLPPQKRVRIW